MDKFLLMVFLGLCLTTVVFGQSSLELITDKCIGCICHASTSCNKNQGCSSAGICGPLLMTRPFWIDGGKHVISGANPEDPMAWQNCVNDLFCAAETERSYMTKYKKDCNGDGKVDCEDYARIHLFGPTGCGQSTFPQSIFNKKFSQCINDVKPE